MTKMQQQISAPDFTLADFQGKEVTLSGFRALHHVVLVFNRGFA